MTNAVLDFPQEGQTMTTREVAEALGVDTTTITRKAKELGYKSNAVPALGQEATWTEEQCAAISTRLGNSLKAGPKTSNECNNAFMYSDSETRATELSVSTEHGRERVLAAAVANMGLQEKLNAVVSLYSNIVEQLGNENKELKSENKALKKEVNWLRVEADLHREWFTVFKMQQADINLRQLDCCQLGKSLSNKARDLARVNGVQLTSLMRDINTFTGKYDTVHSYHIDVWKSLFPDAEYPTGEVKEVAND